MRTLGEAVVLFVANKLPLAIFVLKGLRILQVKTYKIKNNAMNWCLSELEVVHFVIGKTHSSLKEVAH